MPRRSPRRDRRSVTGRAHLRVLLFQAVGVEVRTMRVDAPSAERRMARQAVLFDVTPDAGLEALARGLPVTRDKEIVEVVIPWSQWASLRNQSRGGVAGGAEARRVVAVAAAGLARVRGSGMARQEAGRMVASGAGGIGSVALEAIGAGVASSARGRHRGRPGGVSLGVVPPVRRRPPAGDHRPRAATGAGGRKARRDSSRGRVAGEAALPCMA